MPTMNPQRVEEIACPIAYFSQVIRGKYKLRLIWALGEEPRRFGQLQRDLERAYDVETITPRVISRELKSLQLEGLVIRKQLPGFPLHVEYRLSDAGKKLMPVLSAICTWRENMKASS